MRKLIITVLLLVGSTVLACGQKPQYVRKNDTFIVANGCTGFAGGANGRGQTIYLTSDYPNAPTGNVSAIYIRLFGVQDWSKVSTLYDLTIRMGYGQDSIFRYSPTKPDTFLTGLNIVYSQPATTFRVDSQGRWLKFPLLPYSFTFHNAGDTTHQDSSMPKKYWVIEWSSSLKLSENNACVTYTVRPKSALGGYTYQSTSTSTNFRLIDIGFDIGPPIVGVSVGPVVAKAGVRLAPNPARDLLTITGARDIQAYSITDITGRVMQQGYIPASNDLNVQEVPPGLYVLHLSGEGGQLQTLQFAKQ